MRIQHHSQKLKKLLLPFHQKQDVDRQLHRHWALLWSQDSRLLREMSKFSQLSQSLKGMSNTMQVVQHYLLKLQVILAGSIQAMSMLKQRKSIMYYFTTQVNKIKNSKSNSKMHQPCLHQLQVCMLSQFWFEFCEYWSPRCSFNFKIMAHTPKKPI